MIRRIVYQAVVGINKTLRIPEASFIVDVAFKPLPSILIRQYLFIITERASSYTLSGRHIPKIAFLAHPAGIFRLFLGDKIARQRPIYMDIKGNILYILSIIALMYGFSTVTSSVYGPYILAAGAILIIFFVRTELTAKDPVIDVRLFRNNLSYTFSNLAALLNYGATFAISYLISIYLQIIMGYDSQTAGMILISSPVVMAVLSPVMGRLSDKYSPYIMSSAGMGLCAAALTLFSFLPEESSVIRIIAILAVSGVGFSLFTSPNTNAVMASVDREDYGIASSVLSTMRSIGHTMSMAVVTLVVGAKMGDSSMTTSGPQEVMNTIHMCFYIFTGLCIGGIFIALRRKS